MKGRYRIDVVTNRRLQWARAPAGGTPVVRGPLSFGFSPIFDATQKRHGPDVMKVEAGVLVTDFPNFVMSSKTTTHPQSLL